MIRRLLSHDLPRSRSLACLLCGIAATLALAPLLFQQASVVDVCARILVFIVLVAGYDLVLGYTGIVSFAHVMFFGIGAYGVGLAFTRCGGAPLRMAAMMLGAFALSLALSLLIGIFSLRVKALFFAMITLAVATAFQTLVSQASELTGGEDGFAFRFPPTLALGRATVYYMLVVGAAVAFVVLLRIVNSPFGRVLQAIRDNEFRAQAIGFDTTWYRVAANAISSAAATFAGVMFSAWLRYVGPDTTLGLELMIDVTLILVLGGMGTMYGAVVGAAAFVVAQNYLQSLLKLVGARVGDVTVLSLVLSPDRWLFWLGILFILSIYHFPNGIVGRLRSLRARPGCLPLNHASD